MTLRELFNENRHLRTLLAECRRHLPQPEESHYGYPAVEDPRDFHPDPECSTEAEQAAHAAACAEWARGVETPREPSMVQLAPGEAPPADFTTALIQTDDEGKSLGGHAHRAPWGLGTSVFRDPEMEALHDKITDALRRDNLPTHKRKLGPRQTDHSPAKGGDSGSDLTVPA